MQEQGGLRFTRKTKIIINFLIEILLHDANTSMSVVTISKKIDVHRNYLGSLLTPLKKAGYISTSHKGECRFIANPSTITVLQIVELIDGPVSIHTMFAPICQSQSNFSRVWGDMNNEICNALNSITVQDVVDAYAKDVAIAKWLP